MTPEQSRRTTLLAAATLLALAASIPPLATVVFDVVAGRRGRLSGTRTHAPDRAAVPTT